MLEYKNIITVILFHRRKCVMWEQTDDCAAVFDSDLD